MLISIVFCSIALHLIQRTEYPPALEYLNGLYRADADWILMIVLLVVNFIAMILGWYYFCSDEPHTGFVGAFMAFGSLCHLGLSLVIPVLGMSGRNLGRAFGDVGSLNARMAPVCNGNTTSLPERCEVIARFFPIARWFPIVLIAIDVGFLGCQCGVLVTALAFIV
jgi:hypothetical protein